MIKNKYYLILKLLSKSYAKIIGVKSKGKLDREVNPNLISKAMCDLLESDKPAMIARFGATELMCMINYLGVLKGKPNVFRYIKGEELDWWWRVSCLKQMEDWSGFFPATIPNVERFCKLMIESVPEVDILASWLDDEVYFKNELKNTKLIQGLFLDPFWSDIPWTYVLKGKKVLVIHPFEAAIRKQYNQREKLFKNPDVLPEFDLKTIRAVQSLGGDCEYSSWFEALEFMKCEIDKVDFDICLIGAGAYGFPLAAYVKSKGKKAVHMGGSLQLLFGIKGKRWEDDDYGKEQLGVGGKYPLLFNEYWISPGNEGKPKNSNSVEDACYW